MSPPLVPALVVEYRKDHARRLPGNVEIILHASLRAPRAALNLHTSHSMKPSESVHSPHWRHSRHGELTMNPEQIQACIAACAASARECREFCETHRYDAKLLICVVSCRDCAELCEICIRGLERGVRVAGALCLACASACELCIAAFRMYGAEPCPRCTEACDRCAAECRKLTA